MTYRYEPEPDPSRWRTPVLVGAVIALAVVAGLLVALVLGQGPETGSADPTSTPGASTPGSDEPTSSAPPASEAPEPSGGASDPAQPSGAPGPTPAVEAPDGVLPPGSVARVTVDALRVREGPATDAAETDVLGSGDLVVVGFSYLYPAFGPVEADGFTWVPVSVLGMTELPAPGGDPLESVSVGWAAVGDGSDPWLELVPPRCTADEPTLQLLSSLTDWEWLACYGNRSITLEGVLGCGGCGGLYPGTFEPEWLAHPNNFDLLSVEPQDRIGPLNLHWSPDGPARPESEPGVAPILRVSGHFDDAGASDCRIAVGEPEQIEVDPVIAQLYCRANFVVESFEIIGVDEDFPFG